MTSTSTNIRVNVTCRTCPNIVNSKERKKHFFFFNDTATTEIYTLSLHDALPISQLPFSLNWNEDRWDGAWRKKDRKSTRLNSSHSQISYAVFCLKKKNSTLPV